MNIVCAYVSIPSSRDIQVLLSNSALPTYFSIQFAPLGHWPQQTVQADVNIPMVGDSVPHQSTSKLVDSPPIRPWFYVARDQHTDISLATSPQLLGFHTGLRLDDINPVLYHSLTCLSHSFTIVYLRTSQCIY